MLEVWRALDEAVLDARLGGAHGGVVGADCAGADFYGLAMREEVAVDF